MDREQNRGLCLCPEEMIISRIGLHHYEEPPISGNRGSGTVFFGGCTMKCAFCQNREISVTPKGKAYTPEELSEQLKKLEDAGAHNINFATPTQYSDQIKRTLDIYKPSIPIVYNTSGYELVSVIEGLNGYVDIYLPDFKYGEPALAERFSGRKNYVEAAKNAMDAMRRQVNDVFLSDGVMNSGVIIRHLVLPGYLDNTKRVLETIAARWKDTHISLMSQFTPISDCAEPSRKLKPLEYKIIVNYAEKLGLTKLYLQELESASDRYIPLFLSDEAYKF